MKALGRGANELKKHIEAALAVREQALAATRRPAGAVDITLPGRAPRLGSRHPLSLIREEVSGIFTRLGYQVLEGPEIEDGYHYFEALNMPAELPARDMQDPLYLAEPLMPPPSPPSGASARRGRAPNAPQPLTLLRTHTSAMQIRQMERHDPPVRLVAIGPVYRRDSDLTHTPMFHQVARKDDSTSRNKICGNTAPMTAHEEYLRRNLIHAGAVGCKAGIETAIRRLEATKRPQKWLLAQLRGCLERAEKVHPHQDFCEETARRAAD